MDIVINSYDGNGVNKSIARSEHFDYLVPYYEEMMEELYRWINSNQILYKLYSK